MASSKAPNRRAQLKDWRWRVFVIGVAVLIVAVEQLLQYLVH
jgi:hypothetical protein